MVPSAGRLAWRSRLCRLDHVWAIPGDAWEFARSFRQWWDGTDGIASASLALAHIGPVRMRLTERVGLALLGCLEPEAAHRMSLRALKAGLAPTAPVRASPRLSVSLSGIDLPNPLGLAAGYDKNGEAIGSLLGAGFGFIEIGGVTPRPQPGNPRPRVFRLKEDRAVINRLGFNNDGAVAVAERLKGRSGQGVVGINIGPNRDSSDWADDYVRVLETCGEFVDFATVNVSSPNTEGLRSLQDAESLTGVIDAVMEARDRLANGPRIFLKVAPDISDGDAARIAEAAAAGRVDGLIATNTTVDRSGLASPLAAETGGLSGRPLRDRSNRVLRRLHEASGGAVPLVGVGGIFSGEDAYAKIRAGATAVQIYTGLMYRGLSAVGTILGELEMLLKRDGFDSVGHAVGKDGASGT